jgi:hypothetical protein
MPSQQTMSFPLVGNPSLILQQYQAGKDSGMMKFLAAGVL